MIVRSLFLLATVGLLSMVLVQAQENPPKKDAAPETPTPKKAAPKGDPAPASAESKAPGATTSGDAVKQFDTVYSEWQEIATKLKELSIQYKLAEPKDRPPIYDEYKMWVEKGEALSPKLIDAAVAAFPETQPDGEQRIQLGEFLVRVTESRMSERNFDEAIRLATALNDSKYPSKQPINFMALANFMRGDFDAAIKQLEVAKREGNLLENLDKYIPEAKKRAEEAKADDLPRVELKTSKGDVVVELFENEAPNAVANFIKLVEDGFYNGLTFHRVINGFMAQGGCPDGDGKGGPGHTIECECYEEGARQHFWGSLAMAHAGKDSGGSQFYITYTPTNHLDGKHTVFGRVIKGMDAVEKFTAIEPGRGSEAEPEKIISAKVLRKRDHPYEPKVTPDKDATPPKPKDDDPKSKKPDPAAKKEPAKKEPAKKEPPKKVAPKKEAPKQDPAETKATKKEAPKKKDSSEPAPKKEATKNETPASEPPKADAAPDPN